MLIMTEQTLLLLIIVDLLRLDLNLEVIAEAIRVEQDLMTVAVLLPVIVTVVVDVGMLVTAVLPGVRFNAVRVAAHILMNDQDMKMVTLERAIVIILDVVADVKVNVQDAVHIATVHVVHHVVADVLALVQDAHLTVMVSVKVLVVYRVQDHAVADVPETVHHQLVKLHVKMNVKEIVMAVVTLVVILVVLVHVVLAKVVNLHVHQDVVQLVEHKTLVV